jgi:polysaccharide biosynthesis protein PslH
MKILQLCNKVPYPPKDGGSIAICNLTEAFADNNQQVTLMAMSTNKHPAAINSIPAYYSSKIEFVYVPVNTNIRPIYLLRNLVFSSTPYNAERFITVEFKNALENLLSKNTFDVIQLEGLYLVPYIPVIRKNSKALIILRAHNVEHEIWERVKLNTINPLKKFYFGILARRMAKFEKEAINKYDLLIPISDKDNQYFQSQGNLMPSMVIPVGIPDIFFNEKTNLAKPTSIFFIGALDWAPNQDGLVWFIDSIWKTLKLRRPDISFHIAGRNAPKWIIKKCNDNRIIYHGEVEDAKIFFDEQQIMVVPLFAGSGLRVKIIEAMARSRVIVSTPIGAEGIDVVNEKHLIIAENSVIFLQAIEKLMDDQKLYSEMGENAFTLAKQKYNNTTIAIRLIHFYSQYTA